MEQEGVQLARTRELCGIAAAESAGRRQHCLPDVLASESTSAAARK